MTTKVVTAFDSDSPPPSDVTPEALADKFDFSHIFTALRHSHEVAENIFARCAKKLFHITLTNKVHTKMVLPGDYSGFPLWVAATSITVSAAEKWEEPLMLSLLEHMVVEHANYILRIKERDPTIKLVGPLHTKISEVGPQVFTFSLKQKWGLDG